MAGGSQAVDVWDADAAASCGEDTAGLECGRPPVFTASQTG